MRPFKIRKTIKNLIIILVIISVFSGLFPVNVKAATDTDSGGGFLEPILQFVTYICDNIMEWLQNEFTSDNPIELYKGEYEFKYSPAIIFSGTVPALDINFIDPNIQTQKQVDLTSALRKIADAGECYNKTCVSYFDITSTDGPSKRVLQYEDNDYSSKHNADLFRDCHFVYETAWKAKTGFDDPEYFPTWNKDWEIAENFRDSEYKNEPQSFIAFWIYTDEKTNKTSLYQLEWLDVDWGATANDNEIIVHKFDDSVVDKYLDLNSLDTKTVVTFDSTARILQGTIATWYRALRRISLVGLLSVLVYVGIRIVLTSSSKDKAKYKNMLKDWLVAICLLFTLHYIMSITVTIVNEISDIFSTGETDVLLNTLRKDIYKGSSWGVVTAKTIMYVALVFFTVKYTIQYFKRVIYMAFYTLIAPLITLTYPLDKIKDGQAQAFNIWIKEYLYTALMQVVHLVIYFVLVSSALEIVDDMPLYAIIAISFMTKAENIIKKMFGFEKSETVGALGAAVTGGLVVNAVNELKGLAKSKSGKNENSVGKVTNSNVRTASQNPLYSYQGGARTGGTVTGGANVLTANSFNQGISNTQPTNNVKKTPRMVKLGKGAWAVGKKYSLPAIKGLSKLAFAGTGALVGLASGIAEGDMGKAATRIITGGSAGKAIGEGVINLPSNVTGGIKNAYKDVVNTWNEGVNGEKS